MSIAYKDKTTSDDDVAIQDAAGNDAADLVTTPVDNNGSTVIPPDITPPEAPTAVLNADTGISVTDGITKDGKINVSGVEAGASIEYSTDGGLTWTPTALTNGGFTLTSGAYSNVQVRQIDVAGNTSPAAILGPITVDTTLPSVPTAVLNADTGISATDGITKDGKINVSGVEAGASIEYSTDGGLTWTPTALTNGSFTLTSGAYSNVQVRQIDVAGNTSPAAILGPITVDTALPSVPTAVLNVDTGISATDGITKDGKINVSGVEAGASIEYSTDGGLTWTPTALTNGGFTLTSGAYSNVQVRQIDIAGNTSPAAILGAITVDTTLPSAPIILGAEDNVGTTGNLYSGSSTDDSTPKLFGTAEANSEVTIYVDGVVVGTTNVDSTGHWNYTPNLSIATHTITATTKDISGNVSAQSQDFNLSVFAPNPIENPITALKSGTLLGLIGLDSLGLIKLDNQPILAYDVNNDLKKVTVSNQALIGLSATIKYSQSVADILGLTITYNETGLIVLGMTAKLTIIAKDGGTISNEVMTEFLASVYIPSLLNISVLPTLGIEAWDSRYTTDTNKDTNNQIIGYSKTSATSLLDVQLLGSTKVDVYDETTGLDHHTSTTSVRIYGSTGNDTIIGGSANDILRGGDGNDSLNGGAGNDLLEGGKGNDILIGGTGSDTAVYRLLLSADATGGNGTDMC